MRGGVIAGVITAVCTSYGCARMTEEGVWANTSASELAGSLSILTATTVNE
jgi:hypothetical protein